MKSFIRWLVGPSLRWVCRALIPVIFKVSVVGYCPKCDRKHLHEVLPTNCADYAEIVRFMNGESLNSIKMSRRPK